MLYTVKPLVAFGQGVLFVSNQLADEAPYPMLNEEVRKLSSQDGGKDLPEGAQKLILSWLKDHGFEAGTPIVQFRPEFTIDDVKESLFESTYSEPISVEVEVGSGSTPDMVVDRVTPIYIPHQLEDEPPLGCYIDPGWYIEGWLKKSGYDPYREVVRVRVWFDLDREDGWAYIQRIPEHSDPDAELWPLNF